MPKHLLLSVLLVVLAGCGDRASTSVVQDLEITRGMVRDSLNADLVTGRPTVDVGIYLQETESERYRARMPENEVVRRFGIAKRVFSEVGVQLNLLWIRTPEPGELTVESSTMAASISGDFPDLYQKMRAQKSTLSAEAEAVFEATIEQDANNDRTIYLVGMEDVIMTWFEQQEDGSWELDSAPTNALSFPGYSLENRIPERLRGVITVQNIFKSQKIIAHEIGHKLLNVSHEYREIGPQFAVDAEGGLMVYGEGTEIPGGQAGRWHLERLMRSPFIYRMDADGQRRYNGDYQEHGHYADPIYGEYVMPRVD
jgi:hypothetical protein